MRRELFLYLKRKTQEAFEMSEWKDDVAAGFVQNRLEPLKEAYEDMGRLAYDVELFVRSAELLCQEERKTETI